MWSCVHAVPGTMLGAYVAEGGGQGVDSQSMWSCPQVCINGRQMIPPLCKYQVEPYEMSIFASQKQLNISNFLWLILIVIYIWVIFCTINDEEGKRQIRIEAMS